MVDGQGSTVFPLAEDHAEKTGSYDYDLSVIDHQGAAISPVDVVMWDQRLRKFTEDFKDGDQPQFGRICSDQEMEGACEKVMKQAKTLCRRPHVNAPRLSRGDALMFDNLDKEGRLSVRSIHGGCNVTEIATGPKIILSKFVRLGPGPFSDQEQFSRAQKASRETQAGKGRQGSEDGSDEL
eukprot:TRINITY_DN20997_c0_g1_i1.p2 TRINITY_DN20997_c0_g1~~TRINITY_DN20997_c0_g1_i1.p2  ORF type:complete len:181 (-),score=19.16 TRINITY_DN20997_c0_g1_i1:31-573(-)